MTHADAYIFRAPADLHAYLDERLSMIARGLMAEPERGRRAYALWKHGGTTADGKHVSPRAPEFMRALEERMSEIRTGTDGPESCPMTSDWR